MDPDLLPFCLSCDEDCQHWMTYDSRIQQIQDWLAECLDTHQACKWDDPSPPLPTRVLQLDLGDGSDDVRLIDGRDRQGRYAALTYCWGPNPNAIFKTTSTNLGQNQSRIGLAKLNLLFREVIKILRSLGVVYLWIDALCIVQDSTDDWEHEASRMMSVYSNAYLTMSASESTSPDDFQIPPEPPAAGSNASIYWRCLEHVVECGTLSKRGWCLQERCLSRRIVHLGSCQMSWECPGATHDDHLRVNDDSEICDTELAADKRIMLGPKGFLRDDLRGRGRDPYRLWYAILNNYGERSLSFEKDRVPALSGLIELFKRATGDSLVSGLWRADVARGLVWSSVYDEDTPKPDFACGIEADEPTTLSPSWSWIRAHGVSQVVMPERLRASSVQIMSLDESNMTITLQGTLFGCPPDSLLYDFQRVVCGSYEVTAPHVDWDFLPESVSRCLISGCSSHLNGAEGSAAIWVLVLVEPPGGVYGWGLVMVKAGHRETYRRVGLVRVYPLGGLGWYYADRGLKSVDIQHLREQPRMQTIKLQ